MRVSIWRIAATVAALVLPVVAAAQQPATISGRVTAESGAPVVGANVYVEELRAGAVSTEDGRYSILLPGGRATGQTATLSVRAIGYRPLSRTVTLTPGAQLTEDFSLVINPLRLGEVVVTGAGTSSSAERLGTVRTAVDTAAIVRANEPNVLQALAAKAPGVQVTQQSGDPGASSKVVIRGMNTIQGTGNPLIVVDGSPINNQTIVTSDATGGTVSPNRAADLNPDDIESVEVLKSSAAAAIYGAQASQGVILITTKKGRAGATHVTLRSTYTTDDVTNLPHLQRQFGQGTGGNAAVCSGVNCALTSNSWGAALNGAKTYDHAGELFEQGHLLDNTLTVAGGTDRTQYYLSAGSSHQNGIVIGSNDYYNRNTVRLNASQQVVSSLRLGANIQYADVRGGFIQKGSNTSGIALGSWRTPPDFNNFYYIDSTTGLHRSYRFPQPGVNSVGRGRGYDNPLFVINDQQNTSQVGRAFGNVTASYMPATWLNLNYTLGADYTGDDRVEALPKTSSSQPTGQVIRATYTTRNLDNNLTATGSYNFFSMLDTRLTLGLNVGERLFRRNYATGVGLVADRPFNLNNTQQVTPNEYESLVRSQAFFGSAQTTFADQLTVTGSVRRDGYSTFGRANRYAWFPAGQVSWLFTRLVPLGGIVTDGKLRAAYGQTGTEPGVYLTSGYFAGGYYSVGGWGDQLYNIQNGQAGLVTASRIPQDSLRPERQNELETGIDLGILKGKADLSFTYYDRRARDVIFDVPLPASSGYTVQARNAGQIENRGIEVSLNLRPLQTKDWDASVGLQYTKNRNKVLSLVGAEAVDLPTGGYFTGTLVSAVTGHGIGVFRSYDFARCRYDESTNVIGTLDVNAVCKAANAPNGALYLQANGTPILDPQLRVVGDPNPKWLGSVRPAARFRKLSVSALFDIRHGGDIWNGTKGALYNFGIHEDTKIRGTSVKFGQGYVPGKAGLNNNTPVVGPGAGVSYTIGQSWFTGLGSGFNPVSSQFIEDGSFTKLREIAVGYTFDQAMIRNSLGLSSIDVRLAGRNLKTWTDYTGVDPETNLGGAAVGAQGIDYFNNPQSRSFVITIGLNR